jgi:hypothetical protein
MDTLAVDVRVWWRAGGAALDGVLECSPSRNGIASDSSLPDVIREDKTSREYTQEV